MWGWIFWQNARDGYLMHELFFVPFLILGVGLIAAIILLKIRARRSQAVPESD